MLFVRRVSLLVVSLLFIAGTLPPIGTQTAAQKELFSEADGSVAIAGKTIEYKATAGRLPVKDMTGKANANIFFVAYTKKPDDQPGTRPLTFCFNGGPGTSSVFVHLGLFGPRRILMNDDGFRVACSRKA